MRSVAASSETSSAGDAVPPDPFARIPGTLRSSPLVRIESAGLGGDLLDEFSASIARLTLNPESGNPISADQNTRRLLVARFPYQIVYRIRPSEVAVVALAHLKRRPGYWKHRE